MASEKTPNLGLNQIDRTSPKTTYFDLEKYLDQNWRAVDKFAGGVNDSVNEIKKRLDTTERKAVTLEPGLQIVHAEKAAPFSLTGLSGRTLVNLLGRAGSCDRIGSLLGWEADLAVDTSNKVQGTGSIKVTAKNASGVYNVYSTGLKLTGGRYYIALAEVKNINASNNIYVNFSTGGNKALKQSKDQSRFVTIYTKCAPTNDTAMNLEVTSISTATGQAFYADAIRLYEINASDYAALDSMTAEQVAIKYPYVDSIMPVRNPYAIRYGENMLPSFFEWSAKQGTPTIVDEKSITVTLDNKIVHTVSPLVPGQKYTVSVQSGGATGRVTVTDDPESAIIVEAVGSGLLSATFTATSQAANIRLLGTSSTAVTMTKPMLNIGSTVKPFKPRADSMLALQTDLYADPVTGDNADTVFERDGQYFKAKKWQGLTLDGGKAWVLGDSSAAGLRQVKVVGLAPGAIAGSGIGTKFDGKLLPQGNTGSNPDTNAVTAAGDVYIAIPIADSGWADSYFPNSDDIKAYFYGYKAYDANTITPANAQASTTATWNGTGTKYWVQRIGLPNFTQSVPQQAYAGYTPHQLVYQLATPAVEPIILEGQLSFNEGDNLVEVGTGIVLRERNETYQQPVEKLWNVNNANYTATAWLKQKASDILAIYKNGERDHAWMITNRMVTSAGALAQQYDADHDARSSYSVTYLTFERSPVVSFTGNYAANEKTLLSDLVDSVQQNTARVSLLENKKADKDNPAWLTPTLLNGWTNRATDISLVSYLKDSAGYVHVKGVVKPGTFGTPVFQLPVGYRPALTIVAVVAANTDNTRDVLGRVNIGSNGSVLIVPVFGTTVTDAGWVSLDSLPPFLAEK